MAKVPASWQMRFICHSSRYACVSVVAVNGVKIFANSDLALRYRWQTLRKGSIRRYPLALQSLHPKYGAACVVIERCVW